MLCRWHCQLPSQPASFDQTNIYLKVSVRTSGKMGTSTVPVFMGSCPIFGTLDPGRAIEWWWPYRTVGFTLRGSYRTVSRGHRSRRPIPAPRWFAGAFARAGAIGEAHWQMGRTTVGYDPTDPVLWRMRYDPYENRYTTVPIFGGTD